MTGRRWLRPLLALVSVMLVAGMAGQNVPDDPWGPLELIDVPTEAGRLRLDPALAAHRDVVCDRVVEAMRRHREQSAGPERLVARADEIVERVLEMLGEERDPRDERERRNAAQGLIGLIRATRFDLAPADELTIIVCLNDTVRGYLRRGGKLPHFVYDADTGTASYELRMQRHLSDTSAATEGFVLDLLPIGLESIDELDGWRPATGGGMDPGGLAVHEFVELAILDRIDPEQAHWRWFTDGLASAVAVRVLLDVGAMRARSQLLDSLDTSRFETWRGRSNLRYWPGIEYQVGRLVLPSAPALLPDEGALTLARYAFAFELVDGLVEPGGMEPMRRALTAMGAEPELQPHRIVEILAAETGVDVASLLLRHQSFATLEEGRGAYTEAFRTARAARDHLAAATALLRLVELDLADRVPVEKDLLAADYLAKAGLIEAGAAVFQHHIDRAAGLREAAPSPDAERRAMGAWAELLLLFARYAIRHDAYPVAYAAADELRAAGIEDSVVLTIRAHQLARAGRHGEAAETARRVLAGLGPDDRGTPARAMLVRLAEEGEEP